MLCVCDTLPGQCPVTCTVTKYLYNKTRAVLLPQDKAPEQQVQPAQPVQQPVTTYIWKRPQPPSTLEWLIHMGHGAGYKPVTELDRRDQYRDVPF